MPKSCNKIYINLITTTGFEGNTLKSNTNNEIRDLSKGSNQNSVFNLSLWIQIKNKG